MAKQTGLADNFYIGGNDVSGDINSLSKISGMLATLDVTDITQSAFSRLGGKRDGAIDFVAYFDPLVAHPVLSALPTGDVQASYRNGTALGNPAAELLARQINYDPTRGTDGSLTFAVSCQSDGYGLEWGVQLTAGKRTDVAATNGTSLDLTTVSTVFGAQAYLQVMSFTGTDATVKIQDSADNASFADVTGLTFAQTTTAPGTQRIATASGATIRRYVRAVTVTTGGFTSLVFALTLVRNTVAVTF